jgi:hypothetical protein
MRTALTALVSVGLFLIVPAATGADGLGKDRPRLRAVSTQPLVLAGSGFKPREAVRLIASAGTASATRRLQTSAGGTFTAEFPNVIVDRCSSFFAVARGARGSVASIKQPLPLCPPRLSGPDPKP